MDNGDIVSFRPEHHGFVRIADFKLGGSIDAYEHSNHAIVDGRVDLLRLNTYLSADGSFVIIWQGLIEPWLAEAQFEGLPDELDFERIYQSQLFRGWLESDDDAAVVLRCIGLATGSRSLPQVLRGAPKELRCELVGEHPKVG